MFAELSPINPWAAWGTPEEVGADGALPLLGRGAFVHTGQAFPIDGGVLRYEAHPVRRPREPRSPACSSRTARAWTRPPSARDYDEAFFGGGGLARLRAWSAANAARAPRVAPGTRLGPPLARPSKIVCIGLNYRDHAAETGARSRRSPSSSSRPRPPGRARTTPRHPARRGEGGLGGRARRRDRRAGVLRLEGGRARPHRRLRAAQRLLRARASSSSTAGSGRRARARDTFAPLGPFLATRTRSRIRRPCPCGSPSTASRARRARPRT